MWDRKELKSRGRSAFKRNYWKTVLVALLLTLFVAGTAGASAGSAWKQSSESGSGYDPSALQGTGAEMPAEFQEYFAGLEDNPEAAAAVGLVAAVIGGIALVASLVSTLVKILVLNPLEVGCQKFFVNNSMGAGEVGDIAWAFTPFYGRNVKTMFLRSLYLFLWGLLLIFPAIIKAYSYRMVPYILADQPELSGSAAITRSREMMDGSKWRAFVLDLSFIGWHLLSALTLGLLNVFYVGPYVQCTNAELYRALKNG